MTQQYIIIDGNPVDGYQFYGPFDDGEKASYWANLELDRDPEWFVAKLNSPDEETAP